MGRNWRCRFSTAHCSAFRVCWTTTLSRFCHISCAISVETQKHVGIAAAERTGCNSVKQPFQDHRLLHRWSQYFTREPANVDPLDRSLELSPFLPQEFRNCGASYTLSLIQPRNFVATCWSKSPSVHFLFIHFQSPQRRIFHFSEKADVQGRQRSKC